MKGYYVIPGATPGRPAVVGPYEPEPEDYIVGPFMGRDDAFDYAEDIRTSIERRNDLVGLSLLMAAIGVVGYCAQILIG